MSKLLLIDGSNMMFKAYYGTAYGGPLMQRSDGLYTNALFGLSNILNKVLKENYSHVVVAFDDGKETHRHLSYDAYKAGRAKMPEEFKMQLPYIDELIHHLGLFSYQHKALEADDIIATLAKRYYHDFEAIEIMSSDKDLYQLLNDKVVLKIPKNAAKDKAFFTPKDLHEKWGIKPHQVADLKGLMGDSSDNLPGVPGVGEKTALKLLQTYGDLETLFQNINEITGKLKERLIENQKEAFRWKEMALLIEDYPLEFGLDAFKYQGHKESLSSFYQTFEFHSLLRKLDVPLQPVEAVKAVSFGALKNEKTAIILEYFGDHYHETTPLGFGLYQNDTATYLPFDEALKNQAFLDLLHSKTPKLTYDVKALKVILSNHQIPLDGFIYDALLASYVVDPNSTQKDFKTMMLFHDLDTDVAYEEDIYGKGAKAHIPEHEIIKDHAIRKAKAIYQTEPFFKERLELASQTALFETIEMPLANVLADMEIKGIAIDLEVLDAFNIELQEELEALEEAIYFSAGETFNISSPKQLGEILFERLGLPHGKKTKTGYSTNIDVLKKLEHQHPMVAAIMRYRTLSKLQSTYVNGLREASKKGRIHTIYKQALTQTGRLSSIEPNLQNLPIRTEIGFKLRKVFKADDGAVLVASDYSQIELRLLAHFSNDPTMVEAFNTGQDIHTITAQKVFQKETIKPEERRMAKAVNFGIIYGQSSWGLSEELGIGVKEADVFIKQYYQDFSAIKGTLDGFVATAYEKGYVTTILNRRRYIKELSQNNPMLKGFGERTAMNAPLQGSAADIIKKAMIELHQAFKSQNLKSYISLQIHDELVLNVPEDEKEIVIQLTQNKMEKVIGLKVPLAVNIAHGKTLFEAK